MKVFHCILTILFCSISCALSAQSGNIMGTVSVQGEGVEYATVGIVKTTYGSKTDAQGHFNIVRIPFGTYTLQVSQVGYESMEKEVTLSKEKPNAELNFDLTKKILQLEKLVITGTKTFKRQTNSPVIVNVIDAKTLENVQACNLSEGLKFQPGLRVETDCQTCNYTQLRMNGLAGGYSQILINGRPIFSPLTGLYGMEQLPVTMIDRIEVVRGGGSSLYGSSAIGGTVNVLTKIPKKNSYELNYMHQNINGGASDNMLSGNATILSKNKKSGASFFVNARERQAYDHNSDNYSELPLLKNRAAGTNLFFRPKDNQKLEVSLSYLNEYRFGGEMVLDQPAFLAQQSEERTHNVWMSSADYQINLKNNKTSIITYAAWQNTNRDHYTGIIPDDSLELQTHLSTPPYGVSDVSTYNVGLQVNHKLNHFFGTKNVLTLGTEYLYDDVYDHIPAYNYLIDQTTKDLGVFVQSDWSILPNLTLLSGVRMDVHNLVDQAVFSPRASLLYKYKTNTQFRLSYGTGFRAPQAFDTDLHIAFAGGGISRVLLSPNLLPETSNSLSASINYDKPTEHFIFGFTLEAFFNRLQRAFILQPIGQDNFGELFEKQNGQGATVQGSILEFRANYDGKYQLETGMTVQSSKFDKPVQYIDGLAGITEFIRTPNTYGFANFTLTPNPRFNANVNYVYTGSMRVPHFAGAPNQLVDEIVSTQSFHDVSSKMGFMFPIKNTKTVFELYGGVKNIFNSYQRVFDIGKNRDSNFVFGPAMPRSIYVGIKFQNN